MIYVCENESCSEFGKEHVHIRNTYKFVNGVLQSNNAPCPCCGKLRKEVNPDDVPLSEKNVDLMRFDMRSKEQQRDMLKQRSHEHFQKEIKPYKDFKINEAVANFKEASRV